MNIFKILLIVFIALTVACGGIAGWFYSLYSQEKATTEQYLNMYNTANSTAEEFKGLYHTANETAEEYWGLYTTANSTAKQYWDLYTSANLSAKDWQNKCTQLLATAITDPKIIQMLPSYYKVLDWLEFSCFFNCNNATITAIDTTTANNTIGELTISYSGVTISFEVISGAVWYSGATVQMSDFEVGDVIGVVILYDYLTRVGVITTTAGIFYHPGDDVPWG